MIAFLASVVFPEPLDEREVSSVLTPETIFIFWKLTSELEKELSEIENNQIFEINKEDNRTLAELGTQKPNPAENLPTLKGFFIDNIYIIIGAILIIIILLILLYKINKKQ